MSVYADFTFYNNKYLCGKQEILKAAEFLYYALLATQEIRRYTGSNADGDDVREEVGMCCCEVAERLYMAAKTEAQSGGVSSESVSGWSKAYESSDARKQSLEKSVHDTVYRWLSGTGLLYRGIS